MRPKTGSAEEVQGVLGIACTGHGASLAWVGVDGRARATVLERWSGRKQVLLLARDELRDLEAPRTDVDRRLRAGLIDQSGALPPSLVFEDTIAPWSSWFLAEAGLSAEDVDLIVASPSHFATCQPRLGDHLQRWFPRAHVHNKLEHHQVHQRQAFWQSGFDEAAVLTLDTCGEELERLGGGQVAGTISLMSRGRGQRTLKELPYPGSSPGLIYDVASAHIGFGRGQEGKTMGLAPFGRRILHDKLAGKLRLAADGTFSFVGQAELRDAIGTHTPARGPRDPILPEHADVAYAAQALVERIVANAFEAALRLTGARDLAYAGGVALNSVANELARRQAAPGRLYVAPNAGDPGHALGCALFGAREILGWPAPARELPEYLGPRYTPQAIERAVADAQGAHVSRPARCSATIARLIANGYILARFSDGAEYGPRALGNRSILCDPRHPGMKDHLNRRVKHREPFRPFAPVVLSTQARRWFDLDDASPYMLRVVATRDWARPLIPAVVHVDGSARVQTLDRESNPGLHEIIEEFQRLTGFPLVLNTSFNIAGSPIVESPADAVVCFVSSQLDALAIGDHLLTKRPLSVLLERANEIPGAA